MDIRQHKESANPWKGLNFYREGEILFGRDEEIQSLSLYIINNTQTVLYGQSGIGKSSIVNAGIFPIARAEGLYPIPIRLSHEPNKPYMEQIKQAFVKYQIGVHEVVPAIDENQESLWEYLHRHTFFNPLDNTPVRPLIVLDQFEEIFTLQHDEKRKTAFFSELADVLNEVIPQYIIDAHKDESAKEGPSKKAFALNLGEKEEEKTDYVTGSLFNIVFVIREDFLSYLERYTKYIPVMKTNRFALLPLNEEQAADIITKPCPGLVDREVAKLILEKVTDRSDFQLNGNPEIEVSAAILSLYLSRLYLKKGSRESTITADLVNQFSNDIIRDFYAESVKDLPAEHVEKLEDLLLTYDGRRDNVSRNDLLREGITEEEIKLLSDKRKLLRVFSYQNDIRVEFMHDVLCHVVSERIEQRALRNAKEREKRQKRKMRWLQIGLICLLLLGAGIAYYIWDNNMRDIEQKYGMVVTQNGWYKGLEPLSDEEASYRSCHYVLKFHGRKALKRNRPYAMEARDGFNELTTEHGLITYILDPDDYSNSCKDSTIIKRVKSICQWELISDKKKDFVVQVRALDKDGNVVYLYNRTQMEDPHKVLSTYTDELGFPVKVRDDGDYYYLLSTYDDRGFETNIAYYNETGMPILSQDDVFQIQREYTSQGIVKAMHYLLFNGRPMTNKYGYSSAIVLFNPDSLHWTGIKYLNSEGKLCRTKNHWMNTAIVRADIDEHQRFTRIMYWDEEGNPDTSALGYFAECHEYAENGHGRLTRIYLEDADQHPAASLNSGLCEIRYDYDQWGDTIFESIVYKDSICETKKTYSDKNTCILEERYTIYKDSLGNLTDTVFTYSYRKDIPNRTETTRDYNEKSVTQKEYDERGKLIVEKYFDWSMNLTRQIDYVYHGDSTLISEKRYESNGDLHRRDDMIVDSLHCTKSALAYRPDYPMFAWGYRWIYDDKNFTHILAVEYVDANGNTITDKNVYRMNVVASLKPSTLDEQKQYIGCTIENVFGEPTLTNNYNYYALYEGENGTIYFDEYGNRIEEGAFFEDYPVLIYASAYYGFKEGDVLLACNDWVMSFDDNDYKAAFKNAGWYDYKDRYFIVARYNPQSNAYDTVHVFVPQEDPLYYWDFDYIPCTAKERQRIQELIDTYL